MKDWSRLVRQWAGTVAQIGVCHPTQLWRNDSCCMLVLLSSINSDYGE